MEIVDQIRQTANIIEIASQYTNLIRRGKKHVGLCPFHTEKTPSFTLDEDKQLYHCFGCGAGGDVFTLVMEKENLSFPEALRYLAEKYNIRLPERKKLSPQFLKLEEQIYKIMTEAAAFFRKNLRNTAEGKKALAYLHKRGISDQVIQELRLGYALNSWDSILSLFKHRKISPGLLEKAGLALRRQSGDGFYDRFRGRIIFPIFNLSGKVVAFGGRSLFNEEPKYLNSPDTPIYTKGKLLYGLNISKQAAREAEEIILVEGYMDFLALYHSGITHTAACLGTSLTENQIALAMRFSPSILIGFDGDTAGRKASLRAITLCFEKGAQVGVIILPDKEDPDSYLEKNGRDMFLELSRKNLPGLKYLFRTLIPKRKLNTPEEKARAAKDVLREIEKIPDAIIRSEAIKQTAEYLNVDETILRTMMGKKPAFSPAVGKNRFFMAEKRLLQIIFQDSGIAKSIFGELDKDDIRDLACEPIFNALGDYFKSGKAPDIHEVKEKIDAPLFSLLTGIFQEETPLPSLEEARDCLLTLRQYSLTKRLKRVKSQISDSKKEGDQKEVSALLQEIMNINRQLYELSQRNQ